MSGPLDGQCAIVTAASRGLGLASARALAERGADLVICARDRARLAAAADTLRRETGRSVVPVAADIEEASTAERLVEAATRRFERVDILVANVGHPRMGGFDTLDEADWRSGFDQIFLGTLRLVRAAVGPMRAAGRGRIINISSHAVKEPGSTYLVSAVFRTALASLFKALSHEVGEAGIRVNTICPGLVRTPLGESLIRARATRDGVAEREAEVAMVAPNAIRRIIEPSEFGGLVAFLCSPQADAMTGQLISLDGGKGRGLL